MEGLVVGEDEQNLAYYRRIRVREVKDVLKHMDNGKALGLDNIPIEVWKCVEDQGISWLTRLFNEI